MFATIHIEHPGYQKGKEAGPGLESDCEEFQVPSTPAGRGKP